VKNKKIICKKDFSPRLNSGIEIASCEKQGIKGYFLGINNKKYIQHTKREL
jgi:hypothetical protein